MRSLIYSLLILSAFFFVSCDQGKSSTDKNISSDSVGALSVPINFQKGGDFTSLQDIRNQTKAMIDTRIKNNPEAYSMITHGVWEPEFVFNAGKMSKEGEFQGYWIDFEEDFSYTYGIYDKTLGEGKYHFRLDDLMMLMLDDNQEFEPKVWTANNNGDVMVLVGRHDFGINNGMQIKMIPSDEKPKRS